MALAPPVYEANGQQASTNIPLADWLAKRANLVDQGLSQAGAGLITFVPVNQGRPIYPDHKNWSPRLGLAYSPTADNGRLWTAARTRAGRKAVLWFRDVF